MYVLIVDCDLRTLLTALRYCKADGMIYAAHHLKKYASIRQK